MFRKFSLFDFLILFVSLKNVKKLYTSKYATIDNKKWYECVYLCCIKYIYDSHGRHGMCQNISIHFNILFVVLTEGLKRDVLKKKVIH